MVSPDEVLAALDAATDGPWEASEEEIEISDLGGADIYVNWQVRSSVDEPERGCSCGSFVADFGICDEHSEGDALLVANAPTWLRQLAEEVLSLRERYADAGAMTLRDAADTLRSWRNAEVHIGSSLDFGPLSASVAYGLYLEAAEDPAQWLEAQADALDDGADVHREALETMIADLNSAQEKLLAISKLHQPRPSKTQVCMCGLPLPCKTAAILGITP